MKKLDGRKRNKRPITHGLRWTRIYSIYSGAKNRCQNNNNQSYFRYGGRGIKFLWDRFENFYNDMNKSYIEHCIEFTEKETLLDRIDNNKHYCKENCKWSTYREQNNNRRKRTNFPKRNKLGIFIK